MAKPEDLPAEADGREDESSHGVDTGRREGDSAEHAEHEEAESTANDAETSDDESDRNNGSIEDADGPDEGSSDDDADDEPEGHDSREAADDGDDSSEDLAAGSESGDDEGDEASATALPPAEPVPFIELMAAYRQPATVGGERLPWSWATLSPAERATSATMLDGFVESYNRTWAISNEQTVPPCWHRHPALAHDLATLAWAYYQAYRDPMATPDRALQFQADLLRFAERINRWLGGDPGECRVGRHPTSWRDADRVTGVSRRSTTEDSDAVILLGVETFGFVPPTPTTTD